MGRERVERPLFLCPAGELLSFETWSLPFVSHTHPTTTTSVQGQPHTPRARTISPSLEKVIPCFSIGDGSSTQGQATNTPRKREREWLRPGAECRETSPRPEATVRGDGDLTEGGPAAG